MGEKNSFKYSKKIAVAGILTALSAAALFLENIFPTGKLGFYVFAGFLLSVVIMECGILFGWISFAASSLLAFLLVPEKTAVVPYFLFFGIYSLVKSHIEKLNRIVVELVLKFVFFNAALFILWKIALLFIPQRFFEILPVFVIIVLLEILFFVYDWLFSLWIQFYQEKLQPKISK
ncbi:MAG: hypothetical protein GXY12_04185 [Clostridiaceae bacterium]|jgi:hypothetical protein|nr:hypothetical protein [Clostridiaceae bacterium]